MRFFRRLWILGVVLGVAMTFGGLIDFELGLAADATPQQMTCDELARSGPGDNAHIELRECVFALEAYAYTERFGRRRWSYVPVWSMADASKQMAGDDALLPFRVILKTDKWRTDEGIAALGGLHSARGVVVNAIKDLDEEVKPILQESYPDVNLDTVWIFEHEREPPSRGRSFAWLLAGVLLLWLSIRGGRRGDPEA